MGYKGHPFTWKKFFRDGRTIAERLDRCLANNEWLVRFGGSMVHHLTCSTSDHSPLWILPENLVVTHSEKPFRFEEMWLAEKGCTDTVKAEWGKCRNNTNNPSGIVGKIENCGKALTKWSRNCFGSIRKELKLKQKLLAQAELEALTTGVNFRARMLKNEVNDLLDKETRMWFQRSRSLWAVHGDKNSKYFHRKASQRLRKNRIDGIKDSQGRWCSDPNEVAATIIEFYSNLFSTSHTCQPEVVLDSIQCIVSNDMNRQLLEEFSESEVHIALNQMAPLKAPGPDGMPPIFYQHYWDLMGKEITHSVLSFLNSASLPEHLNHTFITLIPKVKNPEMVSEFRPISLCNVLYKIFSKVLANRLKKILPHIITENQSAFTKNRLITDNILVAFETLHSMQKHNSTRGGYMALKLDMSKAYDRVEWVFLEAIMRKLGFHENWISLMMLCISTVSYSILINGAPTGFIRPTRGIRQGDPLSPFLFLLCTEGLHGLISHASSRGDINGFSLGRGCPSLTHLLFADDSLLFCRSNVEECHKVLEVLQGYEVGSGQQLNKAKTTVSFSKSTNEENRRLIKECLGVEEIRSYEKYLGLPSLVGRNKKRSFNYIKERVWRKLQGWEGKLLSQAGREILIKAVAQAIPTYSMNCFKLPIGLCNEIEGLIRKFWWGQRGDRRKIHWVRWEELCKPKCEGGMGFKDLALFNDALLAKQAWRLLYNTNSLFYRVFKSKFFPNCSIMEAAECHSGSYAWRSILVGREVLKEGMRWRVGSGVKIKAWSDPWLPSEFLPYVTSTPARGFEEVTVSSFINQDQASWNMPLLHDHFDSRDISLIKSIPLSNNAAEDKLFWPFTPSGLYSVKSGYHFLCKAKSLDDHSYQPDSDGIWKKVWGLAVQPKIRNFLWRAIKDTIPTKANLNRRRVIPTDCCDHCFNTSENTLHALWSCPSLSQVWLHDQSWRNCHSRTFERFRDLVEYIIEDGLDLEFFATTAWMIWHRRNALRTTSKSFPIQQVLPEVRAIRAAFIRSIPPKPPHPPSRAPERIIWKPPPWPRHKVNFDGAVFREEDSAGVGAVIRDEKGFMVAAMAEKIPLPYSITALEALAAIRALRLAGDIGLESFILEGDSKITIDALAGNIVEHAEFGNLFEEAKELASQFGDVSFNHVRRQGNGAAHNCARHARHVSEYTVWMEGVPPHLSTVIQAELASFE